MASHGIDNYSRERIYKISYGGISGFVPGHNAAGEQILMGVLDKELLVAFFFTPSGEYLRYAFHPVLWMPDPNLLPGQQLGQHAYTLQNAKQAWMQELGMIPGDIRVRHFAFPDWQIGIAEWPLAHFSDVQQALASELPLEDEFLVDWQEQRRWVLHWKKEYWMTADGEVGDT